MSRKAVSDGYFQGGTQPIPRGEEDVVLVACSVETLSFIVLGLVLHFEFQVISKEFVNEAFASSRERFSEGRKDGARRLRGEAKAAAGILWSIRDLNV